jgi:phosphoribosylanthranilate isomerase
MIKIKICGLFREEDAAYANEAKPDYAGFVFAESRRKVSPALAARLRGLLDSSIVPVGVFVNAPASDIIALYRDGIIDMVQLHGDEDGAYIRRLRELSVGTGRGPIPVIKAIRVEGPADLEPWRGTSAGPGEEAGTPDYLLLDRGGGTGQAFDWNLLPGTGGADGTGNHAPLFRRPWFLAGGIGLHNIREALALEPFGVDVSSGAETGGLKDREKMMELTRIVRKGSGL